MILDGWGIHMSIRGGWVWNLWGRDCVVVHLKKGVLRIGTDDAANLPDFWRRKSASRDSTGNRSRLTNQRESNRLLEEAEPAKPEGSDHAINGRSGSPSLAALGQGRAVRRSAILCQVVQQEHGDHAGRDRTGGTTGAAKTLFCYSFPIADLAQTEETITWAVNQLQRPRCK